MLPVQIVCWIFPGTRSFPNLAGREGDLEGMWRSPMTRIRTMVGLGSVRSSWWDRQRYLCTRPCHFSQDNEARERMPKIKNLSYSSKVYNGSEMKLLRQFSVLPKTPIIEITNASIYPLGETSRPYFTNLTWRIHESETWAVVGPSSSGRRVLLEVNHH
jgi:ABC-type multidrug transport system fused ATPase/permease subunit